MTHFEEIRRQLRIAPQRFVVTGAAGFIGSHLTHELLRLGQTVVGLDNFATGKRANLLEVTGALAAEESARFRFVQGDIRTYDVCAAAVKGADVVLHASSSSVYGDQSEQPQIESRVGRPLSPYAATKAIDELYADTFQRTHGIQSVGLRYFNVFGPRQDPAGPYAAVIPRWTESLLKGEACTVFGDGSASRDFCFVENVVQANLLAACTPGDAMKYGVFNVACGARTTLCELYAAIRSGVAVHRPSAQGAHLQFASPRAGDIVHSFASIERARDVLGYEPCRNVAEGLRDTVAWYAQRTGKAATSRAGPAPLP